MTRHALLALPLLFAVACSPSGIELNNASVDDVRAKTKDVTIKAGRWMLTSSLVKFDAKGIPDQQAKMMRQLLEMGLKPVERCVMPGDVATRVAELLGTDVVAPGAGAPTGCRFDAFSLKGKAFSWTKSCDAPNSGKVKISSEGTLEDSAIVATLRMEGKADGASGQAGEIKVETKMTGKYGGTCTAEPANAPALPGAPLAPNAPGAPAPVAPAGAGSAQ